MAKRFLLAWELGAGFGHLTQLRPFAEHLRQQGHGCAFAVRHLAAAEHCLEPRLGPCLQAPVRLGPPMNPVRAQISYASLLHNIGFDNPQELAARIRAWREMMRLLRTDFLICTHSPIALLAARTLKIPALEVGTGFTVPPATTPYPLYSPQAQVADQILADNEAVVLDELNAALKLLDLAPQGRLQDIHQGAQRRLLTYEALDHYPQRPAPADYLGRPPMHFGSDPVWPGGSGPKVFAYLRPGPLVKPLMQVLHNSQARVLIRLDGIAPQSLSEFARTGLQLTASAIDTRKAAEQCHAYIGMGAHGLSCDMALSGRPGLNLPHSLETSLLSARLAAQGAGLMLAPNQANQLHPTFDQLLEDDRLREAAESLLPNNRLQATQIVANALSGWL